MVETDDNTAELILEQLRELRNEIADNRKYLGDFVQRTDSNFRAIESRLSTISEDVNNIYRILTDHGGELDKVRHRLTRIEHRLDIVDQPPAN